MSDIPFNELRSLEDIAQWVSVTRDRLEEYVSAPDQREFWSVHDLPKKGRRKLEKRRVYEAHRWLATVHRDLAVAIGSVTTYGEHVQAFCPGASVYKNAKRHLGHRHLLLLDIEGFFEAIDTERVSRDFELLGCSPEVATILGRLCTLDGFLPPGGRASPILANRVCRALDAELLALAGATGATYTRYADDIAISGARVPLQRSVEEVVRRHGFAVRRDKCRSVIRGQGQFVTGLSVDDQSQPPCPRIPRRIKRRLRLVTYYAAKHGIVGHVARGAVELLRAGDAEAEFNHVDGLINFVVGVEPRLGKALRERWRAAWQLDIDREKAERRREAEQDAEEGERGRG
jgi:RNA-directed DNA polymerase